MSKDPKYTNSLIKAQSPYLLQHAHNPVNWVEWSDDAWKRAKAENKLVLVSIGYASCHWCHVMEHESFENEDTAAIMNEYFICIKVDREERPDVDQVYMDAVQLMTGRGGWPLNMFCLPDGRPIHGGTYFPNRNWNQMLFQLQDLYVNRTQEAFEYAEKLHDGLQKMDVLKSEKQGLPEQSAFEGIISDWAKQFDWQHGGNARTPKFPLPINFEFLLNAGLLFPDSDGLKMVELTLDKMASGGIYDQLQGGFARYSVDAYWKVPHFEKMLYDNGQLIGLYARAAAVFHKEDYARIARETIAFVEQEWKSPEGLYYSSYDADSEGEEGTFYVWKMEELTSILTQESASSILDYYTCEEKGNWEHGNNILHSTMLPDDFAKLNGIPENHFKSHLQSAKQSLLSERKKRIKPGLDDKCILSWNALYLEGLAKAARYLKDDSLLSLAIDLAKQIKACYFQNGQWLRIVKDGKASIPAFLEDLSLLVNAWIALYQASFDEQYLVEANQMMDEIHEHYYDVASGLYYYTSHKAEQLIARKKDVTDDVIPSTNAIMALNYQSLYYYFGKPIYRERYENMLHTMAVQVLKFAPWYAQWASVLLFESFGLYQLCAGGPNAIEKIKQEDFSASPNMILAAGEQEGQLHLLENRIKTSLTWYLCYRESCFSPSENLEEVLPHKA